MMPRLRFQLTSLVLCTTVCAAFLPPLSLKSAVSPRDHEACLRRCASTPLSSLAMSSITDGAWNRGLVFQPDTRPCEDGDSPPFDSISVGMPRVHRYLHDEGTRWVMWYHGRDDSFDEEGVLNIGTGRIGQAISNNGIHWTRSDGGQMTGGSVLDINVEQWWGFDTSHVGLGDVSLSSSDKLQTEGGVLFMYYFGGNYEETDVTAEFGFPEVRFFAPAATKGVRMKIGVAVSQDGLNWSRLEGEHADGSCIDVGPPGNWDSLFVGWPTVLNTGKEFRLYYHALDPNTRKTTIGMATSQDGLLWVKQGAQFSGGPIGAFDERGAGRRSIITVEGVYHMFYEGVNAAGVHAIGLATSDDGIHWRRATSAPGAAAAPAGVPVLERGPPGSWDARGVSSPHVVEMGGGEFWMFYVGLSDGSSGDGAAARPRNGIGVAVARDGDLTRWERLRTPAAL
ncbi:unnamed protein product [Phaeothamnion confervicola]